MREPRTEVGRRIIERYDDVLPVDGLRQLTKDILAIEDELLDTVRAAGIPDSAWPSPGYIYTGPTDGGLGSE